MVRLIIWGLGREYYKALSTIRYLEMTNQIEVVGVVSRDDCYSTVDGYTCYKVYQIKELAFDYILVATGKKVYREINSQIVERGIDSEKILNISVCLLPNFDFEKYLLIKENKMSIVSNNCWGGLTSHMLQLEFLSPFVNLAIEDQYYIKLLSNFKNYMEKELIFIRWEYYERLKHEYPIFRIGDVEIRFLHYHTVEDAKMSWERRKCRINYNNLFVMMYTTSEDISQQFDALPFRNKVCFVPFYSSNKSTYCLDIADKLPEVPFWEIVNSSAMGIYKTYNVLSLLCGEKQPR